MTLTVPTSLYAPVVGSTRSVSSAAPLVPWLSLLTRPSRILHTTLRAVKRHLGLLSSAYHSDNVAHAGYCRCGGRCGPRSSHGTAHMGRLVGTHYNCRPGTLLVSHLSFLLGHKGMGRLCDDNGCGGTPGRRCAFMHRSRER